MIFCIKLSFPPNIGSLPKKKTANKVRVASVRARAPKFAGLCPEKKHEEELDKSGKRAIRNGRSHLQPTSGGDQEDLPWVNNILVQIIRPHNRLHRGVVSLREEKEG